MSGPIGHERQVTFFPSDGHNHDGVNSTPVALGRGAVGMENLQDSLLDWFRDIADGETNGDNGLIPVPDLVIETNSIGPGASTTGSVDWTGLCVVRFMRVYMSVDTECTITFYHKPTFADEDREFRSRRCANKFLWEGTWIHFDEDDTKKIHYKIENTGTSAAQFQLTLKAGTLVANGYARFVQSLNLLGSGTEDFAGDVFLEAGNGITITKNESSNSFKFDAVAPEVVTIERFGLTPQKHTGYTSSTSTVVNGSGLNTLGGTNSYIGFGTGLQWINVDFGAIYTVGRVDVATYADGRVFNDVKIECSTDSLNWIELLSSTKHVSTLQPMTVNIFQGLNMRYVRFWSNGSSASTGNYVSLVLIYTISDKVGS